MLSKDEFEKKWKKLNRRQKKFCLKYIQNGFDAKLAAMDAEYSPTYINRPNFFILRKVNDVVDYLIAKNDVINAIVKPAWVMKEYMKIYDSSVSEITRINVLDKLSKLLKMQEPDTQVNVNNNIQQTPVVIKFDE